MQDQVDEAGDVRHEAAIERPFERRGPARRLLETRPGLVGMSLMDQDQREVAERRPRACRG